jgi:hypothetical protein
MRRYLCIRNKNERDMKNTDFNFNALSALVSSDASLQALKDMIDTLGLEIEDVKSL